MTLFSIVIPTRERAHLLEFALKSALQQKFEDYEIVICDNCSSDNTQEVVTNFKNDKIKYFRSDKRLDMCSNWELALSYATGEYITYLSDDDAMSSWLLRLVHSQILKNPHIKLFTWHSSSYSDSSWFDQKRQNSFFTMRFTGKSFKVNSDKILSDLFALKSWYEGLYFRGNRVDCPRMLNSMVHRSVLEKWIKIAGRCFIPFCPDYSSCLGMLAMTDDYLHIDAPLFVVASTSESTGANTLSGMDELPNSPTNRFFQEFQSSQREEYMSTVPWQGLTGENTIADTLLRVKKVTHPLFDQYNIDIVDYCVANYIWLKNLKASQGDNFKKQKVLESLEDFISSLSDKHQLAIRKRILGYSNSQSLLSKTTNYLSGKHSYSQLGTKIRDILDPSYKMNTELKMSSILDLISYKDEFIYKICHQNLK